MATTELTAPMNFPATLSCLIFNYLSYLLKNNAVMYFMDDDISVIIKEVASLRKDVTQIKKYLVAIPIALLIGLLLGLLL